MRIVLDTQIRIQNGIGSSYLALGNEGLALNHFEEAAKLAGPEAWTDPTLELLVNTNIARTKLALGDLDGAITYYEKARQISIVEIDPQSFAELVFETAERYEEAGNLPQAISFTMFAIGVQSMLDQQRITLNLVIQQGHAYEGAENFARAEELYRETILEPGPIDIIAAAHLALAQLLINRGSYQEAETLLHHAQSLLSQIDPLPVRYRDLLAKVLIAMAQILGQQGHDDRVDELYQQAIDMLIELTPEGAKNNTLADIFLSLSQLYEARGNDTKSLAAFKNAVKYRK